jgi:transcriptional regulator with XRE-family HTH domain
MTITPYEMVTVSTRKRAAPRTSRRLRHHPADADWRAEFGRRLKRTREARGISYRALAAAIDSRTSTLCRLENQGCSVKFDMLHEYLVGIRVEDVTYQLHGLQLARSTPELVTAYARHEAAATPLERMDAARQVAWAELIAYRYANEISQINAARQVGLTTRSTMSNFENICTGGSQLATYQRYARALGGSLTVTFEGLSD